MDDFRQMEAELRRMVELKQPSLDERNALEFRAARLAAGGARSEAFQRATQGKSKSGCKAVYGTGKT